MNYNSNTTLKVALINPPSPFLISDTIMPPLGLMYLSSYLKHSIPEIETKIYDLSANKNIIVPNNYDIYAFTSTTPQYNITLNLMKQTKQYNQDSTFIIGGAHASCFKSKCLDNGFDCVIVGEGEKALTEIYNLKKNHTNKNAKIRGIIQSPHIENIDTIPFPDRNFDGYSTYTYLLNDKKATTMITSRGCPFSCHFCCNIWGNNVRLRSSENVLQEAKEINEQHHINAIQFYDDTFTVNKQRVIDICKGLKKLDITWRCFVHANTVNLKLLHTMKDSGCIEVGMGVESGSNEILKTINKKIDLNRAIKVCNWCHKIGMRIKTFLMIGLPNESQDSVEKTIKFLRLSKPDDFDYTLYTPFPNTYIYNNQHKFDINFNKETLDYSKMFYKGKSGQYHCQVSTSMLTSEKLEELRDYVDINIREELYGD